VDLGPVVPRFDDVDAKRQRVSVERPSEALRVKGRPRSSEKWRRLGSGDRSKEVAEPIQHGARPIPRLAGEQHAGARVGEPWRMIDVNFLPGVVVVVGVIVVRPESRA
jgi:hypothetical protein